MGIAGMIAKSEDKIAKAVLSAIEGTPSLRTPAEGIPQVAVARKKTRGTPKNWQALKEDTGAMRSLRRELLGLLDEGYDQGLGGFYDHRPILNGIETYYQMRSPSASKDAVSQRAMSRLDRLARATATTSPQKAFAANVRDASYWDGLVESGAEKWPRHRDIPSPYRSTENEYGAITRAMHEGGLGWKSAPKVTRFHQNLMGNWEPGTMDSGMQRSLVYRLPAEHAARFGVRPELIEGAGSKKGALGALLAGRGDAIKKSLKDDAQFYELEDFYADLARRRKMSPAAAQAIIWAKDYPTTGIGGEGPGTWASQLLARDFASAALRGVDQGVPLVRYLDGLEPLL